MLCPVASVSYGLTYISCSILSSFPSDHRRPLQMSNSTQTLLKLGFLVNINFITNQGKIFNLPG